MNTIICFCSCRNDGSHCVTTFSAMPENLAPRICGVSEPEKTGCVSCASEEKEQMLELPPLMTNKQILAHTHGAELQKQPHFLPLSHEAGQKERDILWLWMMARRWSGKERSSTSRCLFVSALAEFVFCERGLCLAASVSGECPVFRHLCLSAAQYTMQPGDSTGMRTWAW